MQRSEKEILLHVQRASFAEEVRILQKAKNYTNQSRELPKNSSLYNLSPFIDEYGLIRIGGRIKHSSLLDEIKHPIILPKDGHITKLIIDHYHNVAQHQGRGVTHNEIRASGFWIINGSSAVARYIHSCITCKRLRGTFVEQKMADLPRERVESSPPFTYCAVDYFGPWFIKEGRKELKRYGVLFTCMASRAIHLEVAHTLETDSFLNAYRRFVCRRGPVREIRSDQGSNFVGARSELQKSLAQMDQTKIKEELLKNSCDWLNFRMNPPHSSHMGGVWERQIRTVRNVLSAILRTNGSQLNDEALLTFMAEAESIINSRPLTTNIINCPGYYEPLTPNHLLTTVGITTLSYNSHFTSLGIIFYCHNFAIVPQTFLPSSTL